MKIGIIGAMDVEVAALKDKVQNRKCTTYSRMEFCEGCFGKTDVVIVKSGVGKVNAGLCVQILADRFGVTHIINTGVAGSLNNDINIGDIVVALTDEDKNTLKRLRYDSEKQSYYLHPENKALEDIYVDDLRVQGVATHVIKAL